MVWAKGVPVSGRCIQARRVLCIAVVKPDVASNIHHCLYYPIGIKEINLPQKQNKSLAGFGKKTQNIYVLFFQMLICNLIGR